MMKSNRTQPWRWAAGWILMLGLAVPAFGQLQVSNEDMSIKFGFQGQFWADWSQDQTQGYQQNLYMRRGRFIVGGDLSDSISFFFQTDDPNLGKTPKALNSGFMVQDAFIQWKINNALQIQGGEMIVPYSRQALQSTISYYSLDISSVSTVNNTATESNVLRDMGFATKGFFLQDHLQYRLGAFQGERDTTGHNALRTAGYLQYDFFAPEKGYAFVGTALGKQKILAVDIGGDKQSNYRSYSANVANDTPVRHGDEIGLNVQYLHFDGREKFLTIPDQNNVLTEAAYYFHHLKVQPFGRFETQMFVAGVNSAKDINRYGGGVNYYVHGQNLKWTAQILRALPQNGSTLRPTNEFTMQMQFFYF
ncbi:MAG TPA: porin [Bryobacteraceae bacterium]|nr:porin [Bryobacteraceae bacterium]